MNPAILMIGLVLATGILAVLIFAHDGIECEKLRRAYASVK